MVNRAIEEHPIPFTKYSIHLLLGSCVNPIHEPQHYTIHVSEEVGIDLRHFVNFHFLRIAVSVIIM